MKKGIILNFKRFKLLDFVTINKIFLLMTLFYVVGILFGSSFLSNESEITSISKSFLERFLSIHKNNGFFEKIFSCFFQYFFILILYFLSGTLMFGVVITPFIIMWQGLVVGNIVSFIYSSYGIGGVAFNATILIAPMSIFAICCLLAAKNSIEFSLCIAKLTLPKSRPANLHVGFKLYCIKYLTFLGIALLCALIEIILNVLFLKFFNFN